MNKNQVLINKFKNKFNKNVNEYIFRISMIEDLDRVIKYGSTRIGISNKLWDKLENYDKERLPKFPILHSEIIIASTWEDIKEDAKLFEGTLNHKLQIYNRPFFTVYKKNKMLEIGKEEQCDEKNQGRHYFFLDNPLICLDSLWQINEDKDDVQEILWK